MYRGSEFLLYLGALATVLIGRCNVVVLIIFRRSVWLDIASLRCENDFGQIVSYFKFNVM